MHKMFIALALCGVLATLPAPAGFLLSEARVAAFGGRIAEITWPQEQIVLDQ